MSMGTRETLKGGNEWDAFSRKSRRITHSSNGKYAWIKARFWRRVRKLHRLQTVNETTYP